MLSKKHLFYFLFFICSHLFPQTFRVTEIEKPENNGSVNIFSAIAIDSTGTLYYSSYESIVERIGNYQKTHTINNENFRNPFEDAFQIISDQNNGIYVSCKEGIYYINVLTNEQKWIWSVETIQYDVHYGFSFGFDNIGNLWVLYQNKDSEAILLNLTNNRVYKYTGSSNPLKGMLSYFPNTPLIRRKMTIRNDDKKSFFMIDQMVFSINKDNATYQLYYKTIADRSSLLLFEANDRRMNEFYMTNAHNIKNDVHFIEVPGANPKLFTGSNLVINGMAVDAITQDENRINFYRIHKKKKIYNVELLYSFEHVSKIRELVACKQDIFILDIQNKLHKISNKESGFQKFKNKSSASIRGIAADRKNNVYFIENRNRGEVHKIDNKGIKTKIGVNGNMFKYYSVLYSLHMEGDSLLWAISNKFSLIKYNLKSKEFEKVQNSMQTAEDDYWNWSLSYLEFNKNELLFFDQFGLVIFNKRNQEFTRHRYFENIDAPVNKVLKHNDVLWIATAGRGLYRYDLDTNKQTHYHPDGEFYKISGEYVYDIHLVTNDTLFVGTDNGLDLLELNHNTVKNYSLQNGLPDNRVVSITESEKDFWLATFNGLSRMQKKDFSFYNYFKENGLPDNEFNKGSSFKASDTLIYLGGMNGIVRFDPNKIVKQTMRDSIELLSVNYYDKITDTKKSKNYDLNKLKKMVIPYDHNYINFYFGGSKKDNLLFKLDDSDWYIAKQNEVSFQGLSAGNHQLLVKSRFKASNTLTYELDVQEVFYKQSWIQWTLALAVFGLVSLYFLLSLKKKEKEYKMIIKTRKLEDIALRYQMSPHFIKNAINNIQSTLFLKGEKIASRYISNLATMIRFTLYNAGKDRVSLKEELDYLSAYISMEHLRFNGEFDYEITTEGISDVEKIEFPPMLFQPIVENAIIHGLSGHKGEKKLEVKFSKQGNYIHGDIVDNGCGLSLVQDVSSDKQKSVATKIINQRIQIYNEKRRGYLSYEIARIKNKTIATIKILIIKPDEL